MLAILEPLPSVLAQILVYVHDRRDRRAYRLAVNARSWTQKQVTAEHDTIVAEAITHICLN